MEDVVHNAIAIVGLGAVLPDAPDVATFWDNIKSGRYSISETPPQRWDPDLYFDPDPSAPEKTYSKIGGWVRDFDWDPFAWRLPIPPKVGDAMDRTQKWAIMASREALADYGFPDRSLDGDRTAVILGNAMGGDQHYMTTLRLMFPEYAEQLSQSPAFAALPSDTQAAITGQLQEGMRSRFPGVTEDTMPGELGNIIAGRVANLFDFHGPNYIVDAACASAMAAMSAAVEGLEEYDYDAVLCGGIDANMSASTFIKFCKIGALSATGTRPYADGADGFVMGEGAAVFLLKRLEDAERDGDVIHAVIRGFGGSSDGKGKGITAPNSIGQQLAVKRAWMHAGVDPATVGLIEGHGTSTRVGDVVELESLNTVFAEFGLPAKSVPLGSVKSNIGHLKAGAGAAGILKAVLALRDKVIPPSLNFERPNPNADWESSPFYVSTELSPWEPNGKEVRRAGASAFGFGGTNFHTVLEEYVPGRIQTERRSHTATKMPVAATRESVEPRDPIRGAVVVGGSTAAEVRAKLEEIRADAIAGTAPPVGPPAEADLRSDVRVAIDYGDAAELAAKVEKALAAMEADQPIMWKALANQGIFTGRGDAPLIAFLYTGQGSQYVNMMRDLLDVDPIVQQVFDTADEVMTPLLDGRSLSSYIFVDSDDPAAVAAAEMDLLQTEITQPAVLATDAALTKMLASYGIHPDMVMGHSLGEYGALVAADAMPFEEALEAVSARGREMAALSVGDNGKMTAVFGPLEEIQRIVEETEGYVVVANNNSHNQAVVGGAGAAVEAAGLAMLEAGMQVIPLPVSHAFHTEIVAPASAPLRDVLGRLHLRTPAIPVVANLTGEFYPVGPNVVPQMIDILGKQVASPVQFVTGLQTLYEAGARVFVEVGPKKALAGFVGDVLGEHDDVVALYSNHPKPGGPVSFNQTLCGLYAAGFGVGTAPDQRAPASPPVIEAAPAASAQPAGDETLRELGRVFAEFLDRGYELYRGTAQSDGPAGMRRPIADEPVVITGAAVGLPGTARIFDDENLERILEGEVFVDAIPVRFRNEMANKSITRLVKGEGGASFETIDSVADVIKLAGRGGAFDLAAEFGYPEDRIAALDIVTQLAIASGLDALRDAGIPLVQHYKTTTTGSQLPDRWMLPAEMRDDTGVIFASAFPGADSLIDEIGRFHHDRERKRRLDDLKTLKQRAEAHNDTGMVEELVHQIHEIQHHIDAEPYHFDRRFLFRALAMGHSQFAEYIGARGPNTHINSACASTTQGVALAEDWIRAGRCSRVIIVSADDVTSDNLLGWVGSGFLASGAAATDEVVEDAVIPFDRRRHGLVLGMGAAAIVVEHPEAARERGIAPIAEVLSTVTANSAFHGTRLDVSHIRHVMNQVVEQAEQRWGIDRAQIAGQTVFVSHETYTPARGGSAQAEVDALRFTFGDRADDVVVANTKGFTGHAMGTGIEDVVAIKSLETGLVPPVPNLKEPDPDLGYLNLSAGGTYSVEYALRLGAGFGSQVSLSLIRRVPPPTGGRREPDELGYAYRVYDEGRFTSWLQRLSGYQSPVLEVSKRTLRIVDPGTPAAGRRSPAKPVSAVGPTESQVAQTPARTEAADQGSPVAGDQSPAQTEPGFVAGSEPVTGDGGPASAVADSVLGVVASQTGYPVEMLELDLDLEADLGIDTVKQAETFAAIRAEYDIARDDDLALRDFPTLAHVVQFVFDNRPDLAGQGSPVAGDQSPAQTEPESESVSESVTGDGGPASAVADSVVDSVLGVVASQTGYPVEMLELDLDLEADLGIDTVKQAETFAAIRAEYDIARDDDLALRDFPTLAHVVQFVFDNRPDLAGQGSPVAGDQSPAQTEPESESVSESVTGDGGPASAVADSVVDSVLGVVASQTGYPVEMLELDLDLEADLGIDTVKQAETFAAIRAEYDIARDDDLALRDFPTLAHVVQFVFDNRPDLAAPAPGSPVDSQPSTAQPDSESVSESVTGDGGPASAVADSVVDSVLGVVASQTGYPVEMLELDLDLEADLGIDTVKQAETFAAIRAEYDIARDDDLALRDFPTLAHVVQFVFDNRPDLAAPAPGSPVDSQPSTAQPDSESVSESVTGDGGPASAVADSVVDSVLGVVASQTGYPVEMLELDLDLEADLGIDTVKQAETFAAIRAEYDIARDDDLALRDFPTLAHVVQFVFDNRPDLAGQGSPVAGDQSPAQTESAADGVSGSVSEPVTGDGGPATDAVEDSVPRRVPVAVLRPGIEQCDPTGVELGEGARVIVMLDGGGVGAALVKRLGKRGVECLTIDDAPAADELEERIRNWMEQGPISGVFWLPALDAAGDLSAMSREQWREALRIRVKLLYTTMRTVYDEVSGAGSFLVSATRLGGRHGYDPTGAVNPLGGAVTGFTKTFKRERPEVTVKAVDFPVSRKKAAPANAIIAEALADPGVVEVGYVDDLRWSVALVERSADDGRDGMELKSDTVFVVTGAAGSITSAITTDLAGASGGVFHLLDMTPEPDSNDPDLAMFAEDRDRLKSVIFERIKASGERATPAMVEKELAGLERLDAALSAIRAVEAAGGTVHYHSVNLLDHDGVQAVIEAVREESGRIDVLLHAGGLEISHLLPDKPPEQFDLVFDVKADGWFSLLSAIGDMPLGATVAFSSIAGRFGNGGQADYSAANDLLCKLATNMSSSRPETRGIAIDWTAWGDIGMATRGSIPTMMKAAGIDMLPAAAGIPFIRRELTSGASAGEVLVGRSLGILADDFAPRGGLAEDALGSTGVMVGEVTGWSPLRGLAVETTLDPGEHGFLNDHRIDGTPVLPGVMGIEAFAEAALLAMPDWSVAAVEDVHFLAPFKFYRDEPRTLTVEAQVVADGEALVAECRLTGSRLLPASDEPQVTVHFTGRVRLTAEKPKAASMEAPSLSEAGAAAGDIYEVYFHGPAYQVIDLAWRDGDTVLGALAEGLPDNHHPPDVPLVMSPRLIELCFQTATLGQLSSDGLLGLPMAVAAVEVATPDTVTGRLVAVSDTTDNGYRVRVVDQSGAVLVDLTGYRTIEMPAGASPEQLDPLRIALNG